MISKNEITKMPVWIGNRIRIGNVFFGGDEYQTDFLNLTMLYLLKGKGCGPG